MSNDRETEINLALNEAVRAIGPDPITGDPELNGNLPEGLYKFSRRYCPTLCVDVALVPDKKTPSVILARRGFNAVAPGEEWIFGGRVNKGLDYVRIGENKVTKEIGLVVKLSPADVIGIGETIFPINTIETNPRDYLVSTGNIVFAKQVPLTDRVMSKIKPADGHPGEWRVADRLEGDMYPYIINAVATAWERFYGPEWKNHVSQEAMDKIGNSRDFIPLRYSPLQR